MLTCDCSSIALARWSGRSSCEPDRTTITAASTILPSILNIFPTRIPVQAGDVLGYTRVASAQLLCSFTTASAGDLIADAPSLADPVGTTTKFNTPFYTKQRLNISALLQPPPAITSLAPATGPAAGGTVVTIDGHDLTGATAVDFGSTPAASFSVKSDTQIQAVAPPGAPGAVDVTATTVAGTTPAVAGDRFGYAAPPVCVVPKLKGLKLKAAKRKLRLAYCKPGTLKKLRSAKASTGKIVKQNPKPGKTLAAGTKVNLQLTPRAP